MVDGAYVEVVQRGDCYIGTATDPRLRGVQWRWSGGGYVEIGLTPGVSGEWLPLAVANVWDYERDEPVVERLWSAFGSWLVERYADDDEVEALVAELVAAS